jgi:hypothetical protein
MRRYASCDIITSCLPDGVALKIFVLSLFVFDGDLPISHPYFYRQHNHPLSCCAFFFETER